MSYSENRRDFADQLSDDNADRLSYLLEAVVFVILSFLSLKECIATSFLSRNWRALWTGMHCLDFDDAIIPSLEGYTFKDFVLNVLEVCRQAHILSSQSQTLHRLKISWIQDCLPEELGYWISILSTETITTRKGT